MRAGCRKALRGGAVVALLAVVCCGGGNERSAAPSAKPAALGTAPAAAPALKPETPPALQAPRGTFVAPQPWHSRNGKPVVIAPPDLAAETWRVFVNQTQPIQLRTPRWVTLPAQDNVEPEMPEGSRFRCLVTPVEITFEENDFGTKLKAWVLTRTLRCSGDGWHSWTEYPHRVRITPDGTRTTMLAAEGLLHQRDTDATGAQPPRETVVLVRDDKEHREATTGPPRILPGVVVDED